MNRIKKERFWAGFSPWIIIGALVILFPIFGFIAIENINRQKENTSRLLLEKGAALIRSFEAGTRTGMGMRSGSFQLQRLLTETAQQLDIDYLLVVDPDGRIVAHNDPEQVGVVHDKNLNFREISQTDTVRWRVVTDSNGKQTFEVFRKFAPTGRPMMRYHRMMMSRGRFRPPDDRPLDEPEPLSIIVGLDMTTIEAARKSDTRHFLLMVSVLLLIGFTGIILLFLFQSYRTTRASLSRIQAFSDTLVENMPIGLVAVDTQYRVASVNAAGAAVLGLPSLDVTGKSGRDVLPEELWFQLQELEEQDRAVDRELVCTLHNGHVVPLEISAAALADESGRIQGTIILFKDLSEVKSLREEVERNQRLATVGRLAAGVAHEIRNPLSSIKGFATYFKERYREVPEDQHIADIMIQEVDRLNRVVTQLLEFARPVSISRKQISLKEFIVDSLKLVERQAAENGVSVEADLPENGAAAHLDPDKLNQVLLNLYLNAIEAMTDGGRIIVNLEKDEQKNRVEIRVSDTGSGIPESELSHIFDPYFTTKPTGTGLGLAIAHNIIQGHGGEIHTESRVGVGTTFRILIPE